MMNLNQQITASIQIPLPPRSIQQKVVAELEAEHALVAGNRELVGRFEMKIQATLGRAWGNQEADRTVSTEAIA
jgi:type I restriction enzyme M protein